MNLHCKYQAGSAHAHVHTNACTHLFYGKAFLVIMEEKYNLSPKSCFFSHSTNSWDICTDILTVTWVFNKENIADMLPCMAQPYLPCLLLLSLLMTLESKSH